MKYNVGPRSIEQNNKGDWVF